VALTLSVKTEKIGKESSEKLPTINKFAPDFGHGK